MKRHSLIWTGVILCSALLTGCNLPSDPSLLTQLAVQRQPDPAGAQKVMAAIQHMNDVSTYQLKANIQVASGRFVRTVDFYGSVQLPNIVYMDETIGGANYLVYQNGSFAYQNTSGKWRPMQPITDLAPWHSMANLLVTDPPKVVYKLPDQTVVSWYCKVYQFQTAATSAVIGAPGTPAHSTPHQALYTVWVDAHSGKLRQIEVQSTVGVPGLGTASIDATQLYFGRNGKLNMVAPSDLVTQIERP